MDMRIGTWNIKTINNKEEEVVDEMKKYSVKYAGEKRQKSLKEMKVLVTDRKEWRKWTEMDPTP